MGTFYNLGTGRARAFFIRSHVNLCKAEIGQMTGSKIKSKSGALRGLGREGGRPGVRAGAWGGGRVVHKQLKLKLKRRESDRRVHDIYVYIHVHVHVHVDLDILVVWADVPW